MITYIFTRTLTEMDTVSESIVNHRIELSTPIRLPILRTFDSTLIAQIRGLA